MPSCNFALAISGHLGLFLFFGLLGYVIARSDKRAASIGLDFHRMGNERLWQLFKRISRSHYRGSLGFSLRTSELVFTWYAPFVFSFIAFLLGLLRKDTPSFGIGKGKH
jgi:hypothetical protein